MKNLTELKIYNTLSSAVEIFVPVDPLNIRMYVCGPTVYDRAHIGNARPAVVFDVLYRALKILYPNVTYVRNITDVDDKIYKAAVEKNISIKELTEETAQKYREDMSALNVLPPDIEPKATEHIDDMINFIEKLISNGNAYISNGHVYFDVSSFKNYGMLSNKKVENLISGERVEVSKLKKNPLDFVLWKPIDNDFNIGWDSPWGVGRPGWHIECSAMSAKYLGDYFDIHGGGIDLIFPHHENEIAQSCSLLNDKNHPHQSTMAKYWVHNGHLNVDNVKMSKSLNNFFTVHDILKEYDGEVLRLAFLMTNYSSPINFTKDLLRMAKSILDRWYTAIKNTKIEDNRNVLSSEVFGAIMDNINTPLAISIMHSIVDKLNKEYDEDMANAFIYTARTILGLLYQTPSEWFNSGIDSKKESWIIEMIGKRAEAKNNKNFKIADDIRAELLENGIVIEDTKDGTSWRKGERK